jgi:hypothetical protein
MRDERVTREDRTMTTYTQPIFVLPAFGKNPGIVARLFAERWFPRERKVERIADDGSFTVKGVPVKYKVVYLEEVPEICDVARYGVFVVKD